jgi:FAD/FMN-containing dehydrogenase
LLSRWVQALDFAHTQVDLVRTKESEKGLARAGAYGNFALGDKRRKPQDIFGDNYPRLQQLKARYDPQNIFNKWVPITPAVSA